MGKIPIMGYIFKEKAQKWDIMPGRGVRHGFFLVKS
jgi:hypothetical protein